MAELLLKIGDSGSYQDGDIVVAINDRRIRQVHAERICHPWKAAVNGDGLLDHGTVVEDLCRHTHQYRFERTGRTTLVRHNLLDGTEEDVSHTTDVVLFVARRKAAKAPNGAPKLPMFGTAGREVWYGGTKDLSGVILDLLWDDIERKTSEREADNTLWPFQDNELRRFLALKVDDFDDATRADLESPLFQTETVTILDVTLIASGEWDVLLDSLSLSRPDQIIDANGTRLDVIESVADLTFRVRGLDRPVTGEGNASVLAARRKHRVDWKPLFARSGFGRADVEDKRMKVDLRATDSFTRADIVVAK